MRYGICHLIYIQEKTEKYKRDKSDVLEKVLRAKLTSTWEGGGIGGKKHTNKLILDQGPILTTTPVGNRVNFSSTVGIRSRWSQEPIFKVSSKWVE